MPEKIAVIKLGGHAMDDADLLDAFAEDVSALAGKGMKIVIVHGGGPHINALLKRLGIESAFVNGLRVTDEATLETVEMVLCGKVNKQVARDLQKHGVSAVGVSGEDGCLLLAEVKDADLGRVGKIIKVDPRLLCILLDAAFTPVVAPVALDAQGVPLNVNADTAAGAIAGALRADFFVLVSDVPGVLDADKHLMPRLNSARIAEMRQSGVISGGMIPKVECCQMALKAGCQNAIILDGRQINSLGRFIEKGEALGTVIEDS